MRYVIHIGPPKTGSTALQAFLAANAERLLEHDVVYPCGPQYPKGEQHSWIGEQLFQPGGALSRLLAECRGRRMAVLSGEGLFGMLPAQVTELRRRLIEEGGASEFLIILYMRNLPDRLLSRCAQRARHHDEDYQQTIGKMRNMGASIANYETVFGSQAVDVRMLHQLSEIERDFCQAAGLPWLETYARPPRKNVSPDPLSVQLLRLLHLQFGRTRGDHRLLQIGCTLPRLENHYLAEIQRRIDADHLAHPKLAPHAEPLSRLDLRDESSGPAMTDYLDALAASLRQVRAAGKRGTTPGQ